MSAQTEKLFPRVKNKLQIRPMGLVSGLIGGFGMIVLLQQFAILVPTRPVLIAGPVIGMVLSVVLNTLGRTLGTRRLNKKLSEAEATVRQREASLPGLAEETTAAVGWAPTHSIPAGGLDAWENPDASGTPAARVDEGLEVQITEQHGDWAKVIFSNGWSAWVDGRALIQR